MTTIAWDGKVLAADGYVIYDDAIINKNAVKVFSGDYGMFAAAGAWPDVLRVAAWFEAHGGDPTANKPEDLDVSGIWIRPNGEVFMFDDDLVMMPETAKGGRAVGSGWKWAQAAMDMGKNAYEAVKYASQKDVYTGGGITSMTFVKECV